MVVSLFFLHFEVPIVFVSTHIDLNDDAVVQSWIQVSEGFLSSGVRWAQEFLRVGVVDCPPHVYSSFRSATLFWMSLRIRDNSASALLLCSRTSKAASPGSVASPESNKVSR